MSGTQANRNEFILCTVNESIGTHTHTQRNTHTLQTYVWPLHKEIKQIMAINYNQFVFIQAKCIRSTRECDKLKVIQKYLYASHQYTNYTHSTNYTHACHTTNDSHIFFSREKLKFRITFNKELTVQLKLQINSSQQRWQLTTTK